MSVQPKTQFDVVAATGMLLQGLAPSGPPLVLPAGASLVCPEDQVYRIESGSVDWWLGGLAAVTCGPGEVVALELWAARAANALVAHGDSRLVPYDRAEVLGHTTTSVERTRALFDLMDGHGAAATDLLSRRTHVESAAELQRHYVSGDVIIIEGEAADFVYTLVSGHAEARQGGVKVGDIHESEVFGAMAAFTGQARSATVIAMTDCEVVGVCKENFIDLVRVRPELCEQLVETMARQISALNDTIAALCSDPGETRPRGN